MNIDEHILNLSGVFWTKTARGDGIDEAALINALKAKQIAAGCCLISAAPPPQPVR